MAWLAAALWLGAAQAQAATSGGFCERAHALSAAQQDLDLRFAALIREELDRQGSRVALVSRSGLDLSRFDVRYSHAAIAWQDGAGTWSARQLYYACDERRPRLYDQGIPGFTMGIDNPALGYVSIVGLSAGPAEALHDAALDSALALDLLGAEYSADAYPFSVRYQNCNQWLAEMLAVAWGGLQGGEGVRERAQQWLRRADYLPEPVNVNSHLLMFLSTFMPLVHLDDQPEADRYAMKLRISLPTSLEDFVRRQDPASQRIEICHDDRQAVVHRGWTPVGEGCRPGADDRIVPLDRPPR